MPRLRVRVKVIKVRIPQKLLNELLESSKPISLKKYRKMKGLSKVFSKGINLLSHLNSLVDRITSRSYYRD